VLHQAHAARRGGPLRGANCPGPGDRRPLPLSHNNNVRVRGFLRLAAVLLVSGTLVITSRNPVHSALFLVLAFFTAAGTWLLLRAEFLAIALVVVYVGAVMVLFLFVVMMLDINIERLREGFWRNLPLAVVVGGILVLEMIFILANRVWGVGDVRQLPANYSNTKELGRILYTDYAYAF